MRNQYRVPGPHDGQQLGEGGRLFQRHVVVTIHDVHMPPRRGMPFIGEEAGEFTRSIPRLGRLLNLGPTIIDDGIVGQIRSVGVLTVGCERIEIEVRFGDVVAAFERSLRIPDLVVIVQVSPQQSTWNHRFKLHPPGRPQPPPRQLEPRCTSVQDHDRFWIRPPVHHRSSCAPHRPTDQRAEHGR